MACFSLSISIHAPAWGATIISLEEALLASLFQSTHPHGVRLVIQNAVIYSKLFQSTHPHGVRHHLLFCPRIAADFNPRTRMGCDLKTGRSHAGACISIHAPAWGATAVLLRQLRRPRYFNPRTRMGCDPQLSIDRLPAIQYFNPRTRMGCDLASTPRKSSAL